MAKDHYISQFYLRRFGFRNKINPKQVDIYAYFLDKNLCKQKGIENIAYKVDLFSKEIESGFSKYEGEFNKLISKIEDSIKNFQRNGKILNQITQEDRLLLAKLIDFNFRRATIANPATKNSIENRNSELIDYMKQLNINDFSIPDFEKTLKHTLFKDVTNYFTGRFFTGYTREEGANIVDTLMKKDWYIFYLSGTKPHQFITSDFPLYAINPLGSNGLANPETLLVFPISPKILLANYQTSFGGKVNFVPISNRNFTKDVNHMIASNAIQILFGKNKNLVNRMGEFRNGNSNKYPGWMTSGINVPMDGVKESLKEFLTEKGKIPTENK